MCCRTGDKITIVYLGCKILPALCCPLVGPSRSRVRAFLSNFDSLKSLTSTFLLCVSGMWRSADNLVVTSRVFFFVCFVYFNQNWPYCKLEAVTSGTVAHCKGQKYGITEETRPSSENQQAGTVSHLPALSSSSSDTLHTSLFMPVTEQTSGSGCCVLGCSPSTLGCPPLCPTRIIRTAHILFIEVSACLSRIFVPVSWGDVPAVAPILI